MEKFIFTHIACQVFNFFRQIAYEWNRKNLQVPNILFSNRQLQNNFFFQFPDADVFTDKGPLLEMVGQCAKSMFFFD